MLQNLMQKFQTRRSEIFPVNRQVERKLRVFKKTDFLFTSPPGRT